MQEPGADYPFTPHRLPDVNADEVIDDHSDICKAEVA
jgi:hypothetical protein